VTLLYASVFWITSRKAYVIRAFWRLRRRWLRLAYLRRDGRVVSRSSNF
jgi:hypothetical protein